MTHRIRRIVGRRVDVRLLPFLEQLTDDELDEWTERSAIVSVELAQTIESVEVDVLRVILARTGRPFWGPSTAS